MPHHGSLHEGRPRVLNRARVTTRDGLWGDSRTPRTGVCALRISEIRSLEQTPASLQHTLVLTEVFLSPPCGNVVLNEPQNVTNDFWIREGVPVT